ncbi:MAG: B12-binding domain-containing radical SAM protein [Patescibacteria group bacterium]
MRVLFINKFLDKNTIYRVPLGILYLGTMAKDKHDIRICDPKRENLKDVIKHFKPTIIAYSLRTGFHQYYLNLNKKLKTEYNFISICGGPHATFYPEMIKSEGVDIIGLSECEKPFLELINKIEKEENYFATKNFWFKSKNGEIIRNPLEPLEQDLDSIPFPDRSFLNHHKELKFSKIHNFIASRGCPYNCTYCFNRRLKVMYQGQRYVRKRSVDNVIKEIEGVAKDYPLERVHFEDDTFNISKDWLKEFAEKYPKIPFKCNIRADLVDEEVVALLKKANCISVTFAIEAGNDRIRNEILKRNLSKEQLINCANLLKKYKIRFITENILANPTSSLKDDVETLDLNLICKPDYPTVSLLNPYPGTEIYNIAIKSGEYQPRNFEEISSFFDSTPLKLKNLSERINLQRIFAIIIGFPFLRKYLNFLIKYKYLRFIYSPIYHLWRAYCLMFKIMPHKISLRELFWLARRFLAS